MKRSNQLLLESAIVASLILGLTLGGTIAGLNLPSAWTNLPNPSNIQFQFDYGGVALLYNSTFTLLSEQNFSEVSVSLSQFAFLNYPTQLAQAINSGNLEISKMNISVPLAISYLDVAKNLTAGGQIADAHVNLNLGCVNAQQAESNYALFEATTTRDLSSSGVPVSIYSNALGLVGSQITGLLSLCNTISSKLNIISNSTISNFVIASPQKTLETGGFVQIQGNLKVDGRAVGNDTVSLFLNGTKFANTRTDQSGFFTINSSTPFVYRSVAAIWAVALGESSLGFPGAISNTLYLNLLFNQTQISLADPPAILPTFNFTVSGVLRTNSGVALPDAPIKITSFNTAYLIRTNASGFFSRSLTVPPNAADGIQTIYVSFAPQGVFGPSINFTTIEVYRETPSITINPVSVAYSGATETIAGKVVANGTAVPFANITLSSSWGKLLTRTNSTGGFSLGLLVPISAFRFSNAIKVSMQPNQPYIKAGSTNVVMTVVNPFEFVVPVLVGSVLVYELRNLGMLRRKWRSNLEKSNTKDVDLTIQNLLSKVDEAKNVPKLISLYRNSLLLAARKFDLKFLPSWTIREIISHVNVSSNKLGMHEFNRISLMFEDYLYAKNFDESEIANAEDSLAKLQEIW